MKENSDKISIETARGKFLFFYPKTEEEAARVYAALSKAGFRADADSKTPTTVQSAVAKGIGVLDGEFFCDPNTNYKKAPRGLWRCTVGQIDKDFIPQDQKFILDLFNKLSERLDRIEQDLKALRAEISPAPIDKKPIHRLEKKQ